MLFGTLSVGITRRGCVNRVSLLVPLEPEFEVYNDVMIHFINST